MKGTKKYTTVSMKNPVKEMLDSVKAEGQSYDELLTFLVNSLDFRTEVKGITKAEIQVKKWLAFGHDKPITATELRQFTSVNLNTCKEVIEVYIFEIEEFNTQFNNQK